ncbi:putative sugar kinase [Candidatus Anstonella stagnisolia]|nr:putative sugar kinase [Candidatus Anstonella stagnisolia]
MARKIRLATVGHIIYDIRDYVEELPQKDKTVKLRMPSKVSGGGSAANVAVNACKLGIPSGVIGNVGTDRHGSFLLEELHSFKVDTSQVQRIPGATGLSVILIDKHGEVEVIEDYGVADRRRTISEKYVRSAEFLHMSGCSIHHLQAASAAAEKEGLPISFDPGRAASKLGERRLSKVLSRTKYLIVNKREIIALTKREDIFHACEEMAEKYGLTCIIKQGGSDTLLIGERLHKRVPPFRVKCVDTIGAGDAFCAGFITGIMEKKPPADAVRFANAVAAAKVLFKGAQSLPSRKYVHERFKV